MTRYRLLHLIEPELLGFQSLFSKMFWSLLSESLFCLASLCETELRFCVTLEMRKCLAVGIIRHFFPTVHNCEFLLESINVSGARSNIEFNTFQYQYEFNQDDIPKCLW